MRGARSYSPIPKIKKRKKCELELRWEGKGRGMRKLGGKAPQGWEKALFLHHDHRGLGKETGPLWKD